MDTYDTKEQAVAAADKWDSIRHVVRLNGKWAIMGHINCEDCCRCGNEPFDVPVDGTKHAITVEAGTMTRNELGEFCQDAIDCGCEFIFLDKEGSPDATRVRLIRNGLGPYGAVTDWHGRHVTLRFDPSVVLAYLDGKDTEWLSGFDEIEVFPAVTQGEI